MRIKLFIAAVLMLMSWSLLAGPQILGWQSDNGARVLYVHAPEIPMVDVRVVFDAGSARDDGKPGRNYLANSLLTEGAGEWTAQQIAERLEGVGAELENGSLRDMAWVSLRSLTDEDALAQALDTMTAVLSKPTYSRDDFERQRNLVRASLLQDQQSPGTIGKKRIYELVYDQHPYASDSKGNITSIDQMTLDDVVQAHSKYYVARNAVVAIVGDVSIKQAKTIATQISSALPEGERAANLPKVEPISNGLREVIDYPSSQTHVLAALPGMKRGDEDYFILYVGNHVLGGSGLVSLLSEEVREKRGLSYSVYSYFLPMREPGPFMMGLQTKNEQAEEALEVLRQTLSDFVQNGPSAEDLKAAKQNITGGFPLRIASNGKIVEYLAVIGFYDLPLDYLDNFTSRVDAITAEQIKDAFQRRLNPDKLQIVTVGKIAS